MQLAFRENLPDDAFQIDLTMPSKWPDNPMRKATVEKSCAQDIATTDLCVNSFTVSATQSNFDPGLSHASQASPDGNNQRVKRQNPISN